MHKNFILEELKQAIDITDVNYIFRNEKFPNENGLLFSERRIFGHSSKDGDFHCHLKLDSKFETIFKTIVYLKLSGLIGNKPINSGITHWINSFQSLIYDIVSLDNKIEKVSDINSLHIDQFIEKKLLTVLPYTVKKKIFYLKDWITFANKYLPFFMRLNEDLLLNSKLFPELIKKSAIQRAKESLIENSRKSYPLELLKKMTLNAIIYIEDYKDEIVKTARYYVESKSFNLNEKYLSDYDFIINNKFINPSIKKLKEKIVETDNKKNLIKKINIILKEEIEMSEASCILIILFLTGMRIGEFISLNRHPQITEGEHFNLKRLVYKTAPTEDGIELEMPIPEIVKKAIEILSTISNIKDNGFNKEIVTTSIKYSRVVNAKSTRIRNLIRWYAKKLNIKEKIDPHQLRHAMAFLIVHLNEKDGLELARMFLGHTSITMTLQYMGHYNRELKEAIQELTKEESERFVEKITDQIRENKKLFGENGKRLMPNHRFVGRQADDFVVLMKNGLLKLIEEQKLAIIQTPVSLCIHDLSKPEQLACQRGFNIESIVMNGPAPSRCKGANCSNALFFEEHIEKLKNDMYGNIDPELKSRLEQNTYFIEAGGFEQDPFRKIVKEYNEYKEGQKNG
ncbi:tyrosine-type recombinase/integrase [Arcobacter arenosus]|uniref:Tyr recombinase domain-containing protein n=1 Tax=Arcobacter arenosus TaxID=2576037 RepID=A0A5R8Y462_9BACT|nr:site-specific integrase [Arcobacter arenosus]TLP40433.1 hypothetical protein FDK22_00015 [Arcobacter arenosus]